MSQRQCSFTLIKTRFFRVHIFYLNINNKEYFLRILFLSEILIVEDGEAKLNVVTFTVKLSG